MSIAEISESTWLNIFDQTVEFYRARGYDELAARSAAERNMACCFSICEENEQREYRKDYDEDQETAGGPGR
jgi:hypothetical protein